MSIIRIAVCQTLVQQTKQSSLANAARFAIQARADGAKLAVFGEMFTCPYNHASFKLNAERIPGVNMSCSEELHPTVYYLSKLARENGLWIVCGSIPELHDAGQDKRVFNTCIVMNSEGVIAAKYRKIHLFDVDLPGRSFKESDTISPGDLPPCSVVTPWGFDIGVGICYDLRFPEYASILRANTERMKVLIYPSAFSMMTGPDHWELLGRARAIDTQSFCILASVARAKDPNSYQAWGHSMVISPTGKVLDAMGSDQGIILVDVDVAIADRFRDAMPCFRHRRLV